jgi:hypothetical protein
MLARLTELLDDKAALWEAESNALRTALPGLCGTSGGAVPASPEQLADLYAAAREISLRASTWRAHHAAIMRALHDLREAVNPASAFDAVNSASILLETPADALLTSALLALSAPRRSPTSPGPARAGHTRRPGEYSTGTYTLSDDDWEALRLSTLDAISTFIYSMEDQWTAERTQLHQEFVRLRHPPPGSRTTVLERQARIQSLSSRINQRTSAWKPYRADLRRAVLDLGAADTPALASAAVQFATRLLVTPAPFLPASAGSAPPHVDEEPLHLPDTTTAVLSGRLVFPTSRAPRTVAPPSPPATSPTRTHNIPLGLHWACKHRSHSSPRPTPTRPSPDLPR